MDSTENSVNIQGLLRPNVAKMQPYSSARDEFTDLGTKMVFLDANENPYDNGINRYPDPQQRDLKDVIAKQKGVSSSQVLLGNGSDEVLDLVFRAFCIPGVDNVIGLPPTYGMYKVLSETNDIAYREVVLTADFQPNVSEIIRAVNSHTKLLFVCSPNNPTGNLIAESAILEILENYKGLLIIDEAYIDFASAKSWTTRLAQFPNLIVTQTLSKAYGMAGIRLGMAFASSEIIQILNKIKPPYNVNQLTQNRALERVLNVDFVKNEINSIVKDKDLLLKELLQVKCIQKIYASEANFVLVKVDNATLRYTQLLEKGIVVRNRSSQQLCENTLRITIGTAEENKTLINALKTIQ